MGRIRTIKPEFPQSESIGALSRDARLLFIQLWTIVDDEGRARAASRMLASLLYPYDDDARELVDDWLDELEQSGCIRRYENDGSQYLDIPKWREHQKIDKPSGSKLPAFDDNSSKPRRSLVEASPTDLDLEWKGEEGNGSEVARASAAPDPMEPLDLSTAVEEWDAIAHDRGLSKIRKLDDRRKAALRARLKDCGGLSGFRSALAKVRDSPFLCGDNEKGWRADFDFILQPKSFTRLLEGFYDAKQRNGTGRTRTVGDAINDLADEFRARSEHPGH